MPEPLHTKNEKIFLVALIIMTLLIGLGFVGATVFAGYGFPATVVAVLFGIAIAALVFTFLGGVGDASFTAVGVKVGGTLAAILIVWLVIKGPMHDELLDAQAIQIGKNARAMLNQANARADGEQSAKDEAIRQLKAAKAACNDVQADSISAILARIEESSATDRLGKGVLDLHDQGKGPFNPVLRTTKLPARFVASVQPGTYRACYGKQPDLRDKPITFEVVDAAAGTSKKITLKPGSDIGAGLCSQIAFDVQLGCDAALELIPDAALRCDERNGVAWKEPTANKTYELVASLLNPELTPGFCPGQGN